MTKKRTKEDKAQAKHPFLISWDKTSSSQAPALHVKGQKENQQITKKGSGTTLNKSDISASIINLASIKKDIVKSLLIASFILSLELMLYLAWSRIPV